MEARVDFERYPNAAKMCRNMVLYPQGGMTRRPGTRYIASVKTQSLATSLIPFEFSEDDSYMIEAGNNYFRFFRRQGQLTIADTNAAITNGTFTSNITGWTSASTGSAAIAHDSTNGRLQLTGASGGIAWAYQGVAVSSGNMVNEHVLRFTVAGYGGGKVKFQVGTTSTGSNILSEIELDVGYHSIAFTPGATTFYVQFKNDNVPVRNMFIDDVSLIDNAAMELTSPYSTADLADIKYFQAADVVYICHPDYYPRRIERRGHTSWSIVEAFFEDGPYLSVNDGRDISQDQLITNPLFDNGLVGWTRASAGDGFVIYNESGDFAELDAGTSGGGGQAILRTSATVTSGIVHTVHVLIIAAGPVTVKFGTSAGGTQYSSNSAEVGWNTYSFTTSSTTLHIEFNYVGYTLGRSGVGACLVYPATTRLLGLSATTGSATLTAYGFTPFTSADVGRLVRMEWQGQEAGYGVISAYTSSSVVTLLILRKMATTSPTESWRFGAWGGSEGYPGAIAFFDGRAVLANTDASPNSLWASQSNDLQDMRIDSYADGTLTVQDTDAIDVTLRSTKINPIFWMSGQRQLMLGTAGGQWVIQSTGSTITPSDISAKQHAAVACANLRPIEINQTILFVDRARREVHDLGFSLQEDSFLATDLTILSDHIFRDSNIAEMVYQRNPYSLVWCRRDDGRLASLAYNKQHQVLGWSQTIIGGSYSSGDAVVESIATIPGADDSGQDYPSHERNELWMIVKRTIDGNTVRYIEVMEQYYSGPLREDYDTEAEWRDAVREDQADAFYVDCGLTYSGTPVTTVSGLSHLEGQTVKVLADGVVQPDKVVSSGNITINDLASTIHVGLPYTHKYESLKLASATAEGTGVNKVKIITSVGMVLLDTGEFTVTTTDYDDVSGRRIHDLYTVRFDQDYYDPDAAVPLFTGEVTPSTEGSYSRDARIYIEGDAPLPFTLLGLAPQMEIRTT